MEEKRYPQIDIPCMGPFSDEEAIARIDRFEERLEKGEVNWTSSEDFTKQLYEERQYETYAPCTYNKGVM